MLHSVDKPNYCLQKVYFVVLPSKLSLCFSHFGFQIYCAFAYSLGVKCPRAKPNRNSFMLFGLKHKSDKVFCFCLLVLGIFHLFTRSSYSFSSQKALEDMERVKNNRITEFHFFFVVGGGITLPKKY